MASSLDIRKFQMIHDLPQTGVMDARLMTAIKKKQAENKLNPTGLIDSATLALYKRLWPYAWGLSPTQGGSSGSSPINTGGAADFSPVADKIIGGVLLYGIFRVLMKVF